MRSRGSRLLFEDALDLEGALENEFRIGVFATRNCVELIKSGSSTASFTPGTQSMSDVSGRFIADLLDALERRDFDIDVLLNGLSVDRPTLRVGHPKLEWDVFVDVIERIGETVGGRAGLEKLGESIGEISIAPLLRRLAGFSATPYALYAAGERWALRRAIPLLDSRIDPIDPSRFRVACRIPDSRRACPALMHIATGALRAATGILDLPRAEVTAMVGERKGEWLVVPPRSNSVWVRFRHSIRTLLSTRVVIDQLDMQQRELEDGFRQVRIAFKEVESSEARYRALAEAAVDLTVEVKQDLRIQYMSPSAFDSLGRDANEAVGVDFQSWVHIDDRAAVADFMKSTFAGVERSRDERIRSRPRFRLQHLEGHWIWMEMDARIYTTPNGVDCAVATIRDVSERIESDARERAARDRLEIEVAARTEELQRKHRDLREIQSLLLDAERMGTARDLAGRIAHSINNPLGALLGQIALMIDDSKHPDPRLIELLELTGRVGEVVERTLSLYREGKINRKNEDVGRIMHDLHQSISMSAAKVGIRTRLEVAPGIPEVPVDRPLLLAALESIAENSLDFVPPHGEIFLRAELVELEAGTTLRISISDTGPGITPSIRNEIFYPFFTTKSSGTGLGLPIARGILNGHQGDLSVGDRPGGGAQFFADLPLRTSA